MLEVADTLAYTISKCFVDGELSYKLRESTIIVLRKISERDYLLLGSYRLIALENTVAKVMEKALANRMRDVAEKYELLP